MAMKTTEGSTWPPRLARLRTASATWGFFAGDFEFEGDGVAGAQAWFGGQTRAAAWFLVFGHEASGGLYALWRFDPGTQLAEAPVVLLGSEGGCSVLAPSTDDFLTLLALDLDDLGTDGALGGREGRETPDHAAYITWLANEGLASPDDADAIVARARAGAPDLDAFVEGLLAGDEDPPIVRPSTPSQPAPTEIPTDPIPLLGGPGPTTRPRANSGVEVVVTTGRLATVFIHPGVLGSALRPLGLDLLAMRRASILDALGKPSRTSDAWDRFDRGDVAVHVAYRGEVPRMVTLMWIPLLPPHLR